MMPGLLGRTTTIDEGFTPSGSPVGWWPVDQITGLEDDDPIGTLPDQSGNGFDATQETGVRKPTYKTNEANGRPVARFTGDWFAFADFCSGYTAGEFFIVFKLDNETSYLSPWDFGSDGTSNFLTYTNGNIYDGWGTTARKSCGNPVPNMTVYNVYNPRSEAGSWVALINNAAFYSTATNTAGFHTAPILGRCRDSSYYWHANVAEFFMYDSILASGDRTSNADGLKTKYATP